MKTILEISLALFGIRMLIMFIASFNGVKMRSHHTLPLMKPYGLEFLREFKDYPIPFNWILRLVNYLDGILPF